MLRRPSGFVLIALGVAVAWIFVLPAGPVAQPVVFNHARHSAVACANCHRGVETSARATIPDVGVCINCHATAPPGIAAASWKAGAKPDWVQVTFLPEHVMFSHRRHVAGAKLECASCHGDVGKRTSAVTAPAVRLDMKACLSCHKREGATEDCDSCHR